jgi:predicted enzyme related to lactoylglutathione lyase
MDKTPNEDNEPIAGKVDGDQASNRLLDCAHGCNTAAEQPRVGHVTGIGGVFFHSNTNERVMNDWYKENLGLNIEKNGNENYAVMKWPEDKAGDGGSTAWRQTNDTKDWFAPSKSDFMIDYRVDNLDAIQERFKNNKMDACDSASPAPPCIVKGPESYSYGKFLWVLDPDGNKVELWEPHAHDANAKKAD